MNFTVKAGKSVSVDDINGIFETISWNTRSKQTWDEIIDKSTFCVQVFKDGKLVGFGRTLDDSFSCVVYDVVVHADFQRQGIGEIIMNEVLKYIKSQNFKYVNLFYHEENEGLDSFYKKFGFYNVSNGMRLKD